MVSAQEKFSVMHKCLNLLNFIILYGIHLFIGKVGRSFFNKSSHSFLSVFLQLVKDKL